MRISPNIAKDGTQINPKKNIRFICLDQTEWGMRMFLALKTQLFLRCIIKSSTTEGNHFKNSAQITSTKSWVQLFSFGVPQILHLLCLC